MREPEELPRTIRASRDCYCYHTLNWGNARASVYHKDGDCAAFLEALGDALARAKIAEIRHPKRVGTSGATVP